MSRKSRRRKRREQRSQTSKPRRKAYAGGGLRGALRQGQPGGWASDHRKESEHYTGWNYVAVRAIAMQAARATAMVFDDGKERDLKKSYRHDYRDRFGSLRRAFKRENGRYKSILTFDETDGGTPLPPDHPLCELVRKPNATQGGGSFRFELIQQLSLTATGLIWKVPNMLGTRTVERYVIPTAAATPVAPTRDLPMGGWKIQPMTNNIATGDGWAETRGYMHAIGKVIPAQNMMVIRWPHPLFKDDGWSPLTAGALWIDTSDQVDETRWNHLRRGIDPSVFIEVPDDWDGDEEELDEICKKIGTKYGGPGNAGGVFPVTGKATPTSHEPRKMAYTEAHEQLRDSVLALHGTPPIAAGITEAGAYAAFYASLKQFISLTVQPTLDFIADEETEQQAPEFGDGLTVEYEAASVDDPTLLEEQLQNDLAAKVITKGEWREIRGREPFGDERDDELAGDGGEQPGMLPGMPVAGGLSAMSGDQTDTGMLLNNDKGQPRPDKQPNIIEMGEAQKKQQKKDDEEDEEKPKRKSYLKSEYAQKFASAHVALPVELCKAVAAFRDTIPADDLCDTEHAQEPHVAVLHGLHDDDPSAVEKQVADFGAADIRLGQLEVRKTLDHDILTIRCDSERLVALHDRLRELDHTTRLKSYTPHIVVARLKPGAGNAYLKADSPFEGQTFKTQEMLFTSSEKRKKRVSLKTLRTNRLADTEPWFDRAAGMLLNRFNGSANSNGHATVNGNGKSAATVNRNECGANGPGGGGFRAGNTCATGGDSEADQIEAALEEHVKPALESPINPRPKKRSALDELRERMENVQFSDETFVDEDGVDPYSLSLETIESKMSPAARQEIENLIDNEITQEAEAMVDDMYEAELEVDLRAIAEQERFSASDVYDEGMEWAGDNEDLQEAVEGWYQGTSAYGEEAYDELHDAMRNHDAPDDMLSDISDRSIQARDAINDAAQRSYDRARDQMVSDWANNVYDDKYDELKESYLRNWANENSYLFSGSLEMNTWQKDNNSGYAYHFETSGNDTYIIEASEASGRLPGAGIGEKMAANAINVTFAQKDEYGGYDYSVNNAGHAHEVIGEVAPAIAALAKKHDAGVLAFSAASDEPSRQRLYDRMIKVTAKLAPEYFAVATGGSEPYTRVWDESMQRYYRVRNDIGSTRYYYVIKREYKPQVDDIIAKNPDTDIETLVKTMQRRGIFKAISPCGANTGPNDQGFGDHNTCASGDRENRGTNYLSRLRQRLGAPDIDDATRERINTRVSKLEQILGISAPAAAPRERRQNVTDELKARKDAIQFSDSPHFNPFSGSSPNRWDDWNRFTEEQRDEVFERWAEENKDEYVDRARDELKEELKEQLGDELSLDERQQLLIDKASELGITRESAADPRHFRQSGMYAGEVNPSALQFVNEVPGRERWMEWRGRVDQWKDLTEQRVEERLTEAVDNIDEEEVENKYKEMAADYWANNVQVRERLELAEKYDITPEGESAEEGDKPGLNEWMRSSPSRWNYYFTTEGGENYTVEMSTTSRYIPGSTEKVYGHYVTFARIDDYGGTDYSIANTGNAVEVMANVVPAVAALAEKEDTGGLAFSADSDHPSRQRLYDRLTKFTARIMPDYFAVAQGSTEAIRVWNEAEQRYDRELPSYNDRETREYLIMKRKYQEQFERSQQSGGEASEYDVLVKMLRAGSRMKSACGAGTAGDPGFEEENTCATGRPSASRSTGKKQIEDMDFDEFIQYANEQDNLDHKRAIAKLKDEKRRLEAGEQPQSQIEGVYWRNKDMRLREIEHAIASREASIGQYARDKERHRAVWEIMRDRKKTSTCGAGEVGDPGFQEGNTCATSTISPDGQGMKFADWTPEEERKFQAYRAKRDQKEARLAELFEEAISEQPSVSRDRAKSYSDAAIATARRMTDAQLDRMLANTKYVQLYENVAELTDQFMPGQRLKFVGGAWVMDEKRWSQGVLHLDGGMEDGEPIRQFTEQLFAHEFTHAFDGAPGGKSEFTSGVRLPEPNPTHATSPLLSDTYRWRKVWKQTINTPDAPLSKYATTSAAEGFAEYGRLVLTQPREAKRLFPDAWAAWQRFGLIPQDGAKPWDTQ